MVSGLTSLFETGSNRRIPTFSIVARRGRTPAEGSSHQFPATAPLVVEAVALGLAVHQMAGFDHQAVSRAIEIPEGYALGSVIAVAYQDEPATHPNEHLLTQEVAPRQRKPLKDFVFSAWGSPLHLE